MLQEIAQREKYSIHVDTAKNRIYFYPKGIWNSVSDVPDYIGDLKACAKKLRRGFTLLSDATHFAAPTQEIVKLMFEEIAIMREKGQKRAAVLVDSSIIKMYLDTYKDKMDAETMTTRYFDNMDEAERWLDMA